MPTAAKLNSAFSKAVQMVLELHGLSLQGKGNSPEALAACTAMEDSWHSLSQEEQELVGGLSEDLYAVEDGGAKQQRLSSEDRERWLDQVKEAAAQCQQGHYAAALSLFRAVLTPESIHGGMLAVGRAFQALCWEKLGEPEVASVFMKDAERLDPNSREVASRLLENTNPVKESPSLASLLISEGAANLK